MKKIFTASLLILCVVFTNAQLSNSSFENWYSSTDTFSFVPFIPLDTFPYTAPVDWTCSNSITMSPGLHSTQLADSSAMAYSGNKSLYLRTDSIYIDAAGLYLTIPGFVVNGNFPLHISDLFGGNGLNPTNLEGAGVPFS
ncbi:MAG TPA: hypothetical protein VG603_07635, partial [Chitinophagales bacterium]|nr:hypothetical protein [Chitinophagales bacterium]